MIFSAKIIRYLDISRLDTCQVMQHCSNNKKCVYVWFSRYLFLFVPLSHLSFFLFVPSTNWLMEISVTFSGTCSNVS